MTIKDAAQIVYQLHASYPADRKATEQDLLSRIETFSITFADFDFETVNLAVKHCIISNKFMPTVQEVLTAAKLLRTLGTAQIIGPEEPEQTSDQKTEEYLENLCQFVGLGYEDKEDTFLNYEL